MARTKMSTADKIENAKTAKATIGQSDFVVWLKEITGLKVDERSVILAQKLYAEFLTTPDAAAGIAERKVAAAAKKNAATEKSRETFMKRAAAYGLAVSKISDEDAE